MRQFLPGKNWYPLSPVRSQRIPWQRNSAKLNFKSSAPNAVSHYWRTLHTQARKQQRRDADRGARAAVTGGKQMDGFCELIRYVPSEAGIEDLSIFHPNRLELPGFFRPSKKWDMLVLQNGSLLAALEFKSQRGPSFGNNFNNRVEEAVGSAHDLWTAFREGALGETHPKPWTG